MTQKPEQDLNAKQQELLFKFSMFEQRIQAIQQQIKAVEESAIDLDSLNLGLDELSGKMGEDILAPMGRGIFVKAKLSSEDLLVDVGGKNFVNKSISETKEIIGEQIGKLDKIKKELNEKLSEIDQELMKTIEEAQKAASEED